MPPFGRDAEQRVRECLLQEPRGQAGRSKPDGQQRTADGRAEP